MSCQEQAIENMKMRANEIQELLEDDTLCRGRGEPQLNNNDYCNFMDDLKILKSALKVHKEYEDMIKNKIIEYGPNTNLVGLY